MKQNKTKGESVISSQGKRVCLFFFTDHRNLKQKIGHATWGDQTDLNTYEVNNFIKVLKVSVRRCWVKTSWVRNGKPTSAFLKGTIYGRDT